MIKRIFLDLDDVLVPFTECALAHVGCYIKPGELWDKYSPEWGWDIVKAANELMHDLGWASCYTPETFWNSFGEEFWADLPLAAGAKRLHTEACELVGEENVFISSAPTRCPSCASGKIRWIQRNIPDRLQRQYILTPHKHLLASRESLLVDDREENCEKFCAAGGHAVMVPKPWNMNGVSMERYLILNGEVPLNIRCIVHECEQEFNL